MNRQGAVSGMLCGFFFTAAYIVYFKFVSPELSNAANWWFGISPEGIGALGTVINAVVALTVCRFYAAPPKDVQNMVEEIRLPGN
jgi:cation/acetate symporter